MTNLAIKVDNLAKKYCLDLHTSLRYGVADIVREISGRQRTPDLRTSEFWALSDVSFTLEKGKCLGLIGGNGAGKSSLLKLINGLIRPDIGTIEVSGKVGALIELGLGFNPVLTGMENIYINGAILGIEKKVIEQEINQIIDFAGIKKFINSPVGNYSSGMKVRLGFSIALHMNPEIMLVDEVLAVGDLEFRLRALENIKKLMLSGMSTIFVSHNLTQVKELCDEVIWLDGGKIVDKGDTLEVCDKYEKKMLTSGYVHTYDKDVNHATVFKVENYNAEIIYARFKKDYLEKYNNNLQIDNINEIKVTVKLSIQNKVNDLILKYGFRTIDGRLLYGSYIQIPGENICIYEVSIKVERQRILSGLLSFSCSIHSGLEWGNAIHVVRDVDRMLISNNHLNQVGIVDLNPEIEINLLSDDSARNV